MKTGIFSIIDTDIKSKLDTGMDLRLKPATKQDYGQALKLDYGQIQQLKPKQKQKLKQRAKLKSKQKLKPTIFTPFVPRTRLVVDPFQLKPAPDRYFRRRRKKPKKKKGGKKGKKKGLLLSDDYKQKFIYKTPKVQPDMFKLFVRKKGTWKAIGGLLPKGLALKKGASIVKGTLAASFKLMKAGKTAKTTPGTITDISYKISPMVFRAPKREPGMIFIQRGGKEPTFIRGARLASPGERREFKFLRGKKRVKFI